MRRRRPPVVVQRRINLVSALVRQIVPKLSLQTNPRAALHSTFANFMSKSSHPLLPYSITWRPWRCQELFYTAFAGLYQDFRRFFAFLRDFATKIGGFASRPREFVGVIFLCFRLRCILTIPTWRCNILIIEKYIKNTR